MLSRRLVVRLFLNFYIFIFSLIEALDSTTKELDDAKDELANLKEYNEGLNEEIVKLNNTVKVKLIFGPQ